MKALDMIPWKAKPTREAHTSNRTLRERRGKRSRATTKIANEKKGK